MLNYLPLKLRQNTEVLLFVNNSLGLGLGDIDELS